jgi:hypothetical protein
MRRILFAAALAALAGACGQAFAPASLVAGLRVLAVRAEPPHLRPGGATVLTALVADPRGTGREVSYLWATCIPPGLITDLLVCQKPENLRSLGVGPSARLDVPSDFLETGTAGPVLRRSIFVVLSVSAGEERVTAFKEVVVVSAPEPLNQNPRILGARAEVDGGAVAEVGPRVAVMLVADVDPGSKEKYVEEGVEKTEEMMLSWFVTSGALDRQRSFDEYTNTWTTPLSAQTVQIWVVLRDQREGVDWTTFSVVVR